MMRQSFDVVRMFEERRWIGRDAQRCGLLAEIKRLYPGIGENDASDNEMLLSAAANWMLNGFPRVTMGHKHAALLMCTQVPLDVIDVVPMPWSAFLIDVPPGLVSTPPRPHGEPPGQVDHVLVWRCGDDDASCFMLNGVFGCAEGRFNLKHVLGLAPRTERLAKTIARFVLGACIEFAEHRPAQNRARIGALQIKRGARGEPETDTYVLRRDVQIDCRPAVREYCAGSGTSPTVRILVRGHWKYQPHGKGSTERKFIQVNPYWRGPNDAPIALRSHTLGATETQA